MGKVFTGIGVYGITCRKHVLDLRGLEIPPKIVKRVTVEIQLEILLQKAGIEDMEKEVEFVGSDKG